MANKSTPSRQSKKSGRTLKEKRAAKRAKQDEKAQARKSLDR